MIVEPFQPYHIDLLRAQGVQAAQLREVSIVSGAYALNAAPIGPAVTARDGDHILICGGLRIDAPKRATCWALMAADAGKHITALHRAVQRFISLDEWIRLEATVEEGFTPGCRWVELLGFQFEGRMLKYGPSGETHLRYARVS